MTWWQGTLSSTDPRKDLLAKLVQMATSKYVATVAVNAGGTGYAVNDVLTLTHASAVLDATIVVTAVSGGVITGLRIRNGGAFGRRVASVAINAAGSGYNAGDIVEIDEGHVAGTDFQERCKIRIDSVTGGPPGPAATISILDGGGNYDGGTDPSASASTTTLIGPSTGSGSGLTVNVTMQALISTLTGLSVTGGSGSGATVDVTLGGPGWHADINRHNFSHNSLDDEREIILTSEIASGDPGVVGFRSYTTSPAVDTFEGVLFTAMEAANPALAFASQQGILTSSTAVSTASGAYITMFEATAASAWLSVTERKLMGVVFNDGVTVDSYVSFYVGLGNPFGTAVENPLPLVVLASSSSRDIEPDAGGLDQTSILEQFRESTRTGPCFYRIPATGAWGQMYTGLGASFPVAAFLDQGCFPLFQPRAATAGDDDEIVNTGAFTFFNSVGRNTGAAGTLVMRPTPGTNDRFAVFPVVMIREVDEDVHLELEGVFWTCAVNAAGSALAPLDTITDVSGNVYLAFPSGDRTEQYSFFFLQEGA